LGSGLQLGAAGRHVVYEVRAYAAIHAT
jgi:hypothetical protein